MRVSLVAKTSTDIRGTNRLDADSPKKASEPLSLGELLGYIARVSNPSNQMNTQTTSKGGMGPAAKMSTLKELITFCLDQFKDGQIKGFRMIIDSGQEQFDDISIGTLAG